ncbi:sulfatase [Synechococcus sp. R55.8]|uniref:sulfatase n=1 Tax=Synechococcus sp. R55.8 TaxID=2964501 RepID=UPI0039C38901
MSFEDSVRVAQTGHSPARAGAAAVERPNILLIVLDTQRADRLSCYWSEAERARQLPTSPNLDRLAAESTLFERAIAPAQWTIPSHASLFTGEYPSTHQTVQADLELSPALPTLAELLQLSGYTTVGFCNNPLVGILKNGLRRGFETFYNYGGALPTRPPEGTPLPAPLNRWLAAYTQFWRRLSYPVQNAFARSDALFQLALHPWFASLWTRLLNFKGNTAASIADLNRYLQQMARRRSDPGARPFFCFVNLMEPHLPYWPPEPFVQKYAPYFKSNREARDFLRQYNAQPYRWMAPLPQPLSPLQAQVLRDIYDAEVAYQDHLLGSVFDTLRHTGLEQNTLVAIVADHGEGLGEHDFVGHAFVVYEELIRVPLILRYPGHFPAGKRIATPVSTRRLFHTLLEAAGFSPNLSPNGAPCVSLKLRREVARLSLARTLAGEDPEQGTVLSEAFPPHLLIRAMESRNDSLLRARACYDIRRALYEGMTKLIQTGDRPSLYNLEQDPAELRDLLWVGDGDPVSSLPDADPQRCHDGSAGEAGWGSLSPQAWLARLQQGLRTWVSWAESRRPSTAPRKVNVESDADLVRQMQELGYLE